MDLRVSQKFAVVARLGWSISAPVSRWHEGRSAVSKLYKFHVLELGFFSYVEDDALGTIVNYHRTSLSDSSSTSLRMVCPHIYLDYLIGIFSESRDLRSEHIVCTSCKGFQYCKDCLSTVFRFTKDIASTSVMCSNSVIIIRQSDEKL